MKNIAAIFLGMIWVSVNEFVRNQIVFIDKWEKHYSDLGITFPAQPVNGAIWGVWSLLFALGLWILLRKFSVRDTILTGWFFGFVLMWITIGNLSVLPYSILIFAVPWSLFEVAGATMIINKITKR